MHFSSWPHRGHSRTWAGRLVRRQKSLTSYLKISMSGKTTQRTFRYLLRRRVLDELDPFLDVTLEARDSSLDKLLLVGVGASENIDGFLCSLGLRKMSAEVRMRLR